MLRTVSLAFGAIAAGFAAQPYCDAPPEVQSELQRASRLGDRPGPRAQFIDDRKAILEALVLRFPNDIQANRRYQNDSEDKKDELIAEYKARLDANPGDPLLTYFYALTLFRTDTPLAIRLLNEVLGKDPNHAWAHMGLAYVYAWGRFADRAKAGEHMDKFFSLCPTVYDSHPVRMLSSNGSSETQKRVAKALRERLSTETNPDYFGMWPPLWNLEFRSTPPTGHPELRKQIATDVKRIRDISPKPELATLRIIRDGLKQAADSAGVTATEDDLVRLFPKSHEAAEIVRSRWLKEHPYPKPADGEEKKREWALARYPLAAKWIEQWPWDPSAWEARFSSALLLKDLPPAEVKAAVDGLLEFLRKDEVMWGFPPFPHRAAHEYLKRGIHLEETVALAEEGLRGVQKREGEQELNDMEPPEMAKYSAGAIRSAEINTIDLLAQAYLKLKKPDQAAALQTRLDAVTPDEDREKTAKMRAMSRVAELGGRRADAFAYLEKTIEISPKPTDDYMKKADEELRADLKRLWTEMGGSEDTWKLRTERRAEVQEAKGNGEWKAPEKIIPAFRLADLSGKTWTTDHFAGKALLVNVWASWCGPCRAEHPKLQKLYESIRDRKDIAVVSFNVDDQIGFVQPYLEEGKYTFPVLLADKFINGIFNGISIPRNWLVDGKGVHRLEQIGYGESSDWVERMIQALEKLSLDSK